MLFTGSSVFQSAKKLMDVAIVKAHELGYDETKPRPKVRASIPAVRTLSMRLYPCKSILRFLIVKISIKEEQSESSSSRHHPPFPSPNVSAVVVLPYPSFDVSFRLNEVVRQKSFCNTPSKTFMLSTTTFENIK